MSATGMPDRRTRTLVPVQWLRAVAAVMVVVFHADFYARSLSGPAAAPFAIGGFASWGFGVHLFFVISGFIMVLTTREWGSVVACRTFLVRRVIRVAPLYWIMTSLMVVSMIAAPHALAITTDRFRYVASSYLFIPVLRSAGDLRPILGQGWTLTFEMFFYVVFALATLLPRRHGIAALTAAFVAAVWLGRGLDETTPILFTWTNPLLLEFLLGAYLGLAYDRGVRLPGWAAALVVAMGVALIATDRPGSPFALSCASAGLIVAGAVLGPRIRDGLATAWLTAVGDASYALYLSHTFVLRPFRDLWAALGDRIPPQLYLVAVVALAVVIGLAVHRLVERPVILGLRRIESFRRLPRSRGIAPATPVADR